MAIRVRNAHGQRHRGAQAPAVVGPANNQLAEPDGAELLASGGIIYAPDYLVSAGGVIYRGTPGLSDDERLDRIDGIGASLASVFDEAEVSGTTAVAAADRIVQDILQRASSLTATE